ncbi:unnamed protein product [Polarella glacialis]|uniref:Molybdopterin cofactor biosynthesis C (MoaC) domain-containing protein n=1 Tax=Polarella glacialis TaxID=89957 RepID=A0A813H3K9_POLGL|nr:unnamed protein product [Polarella glacialis]CAE8664646.1 unnamed protein product [Polarella glacialis]
MTHRRAVAGCTVLVGEEVARALAAGTVAKGDVFTVSEVAGIMAAKRTPDILPLCHPLPLTRAFLVEVSAEVTCVGQTGVEMESLTAAAAAALCIYDMCKPISKGIVITNLRLMSKSGGKSLSMFQVTVCCVICLLFCVFCCCCCCGCCCFVVVVLL